MEGFTLVELMVTVAVLAILAGLAAPSFADFMRRNQVTSQSAEFLGALRFARATAIEKNQFISICPSAKPTDASPLCADSNDYSQGWIMYTATAANKAFESGNTLVRVNQAAPNISLLAPSAGKVITFSSRGASTAGTLRFLLCSRRGGDAGQSTLRATGRRIDLQASGRAGIAPLDGSASTDQAEKYCKPT
ncbi:GspH/FimT family pseudopilin [Luteibacter sp. 3190]|uniref:GspH/FimT family pseudopilin n=1 Tax=Luteibacter sp. 3190 TaxID=2817736 RepID=UPI002856331E|nr:GspH/FimT family pseudopilin [Luteibacter sp. 3190]MDR6936458.1 type IV fimbrial biogenesis protein FimT [Luteibacter sp. 3190]